jgi:hypothetical protein
MNVRGKPAIALVGLTLCATCGITLAAGSAPAFVQNGKAGFVVAHIEFALAPDAKDTGACPNGMTQGMRREGGASGTGGYGQGGGAQRPSAAPSATQPPASSGVQRGEGASTGGKPAVSEEEAQRQYIRNMMDPNRPDPCRNPEAAAPDPGFRTAQVPSTKAYGIDLDGRDSRAKGKPAPGTCAHDDLVGMNGEHGIDNQFYRLVGCSNSYQTTGQSNTFAIEMLTGSWGILIELSGVDDIRNDDSVEVGIYANADPIELSANREPLANATYAAEQDPRFQTKTRGRLKDGVLTTDPADMRFHWVVNSIYLERPLRDARVQLTLNANGVMEGYLAGYTPVEELYDVQYGFRTGKNAKGEPADARLIRVSSNGQAAVLGHTCNGAYYAIKEVADGHPDAKTGKCTSVSTQYRIKAIPAFVVAAKTKSINDDLAR